MLGMPPNGSSSRPLALKTVLNQCLYQDKLSCATAVNTSISRILVEYSSHFNYFVCRQPTARLVYNNITRKMSTTHTKLDLTPFSLFEYQFKLMFNVNIK